MGNSSSFLTALAIVFGKRWYYLRQPFGGHFVKNIDSDEVLHACGTGLALTVLQQAAEAQATPLVARGYQQTRYNPEREDQMNTASKLTLAALALVVAGATTAQAQGVNGSITATASVQAPITVSGTRGLDFGNVFPGISKTIAVGDPGAGLFSVTGQASTQITYAFTLPGNLTFGLNNLPISPWTGYVNTTNSTSGGSTFPPSAVAANATLSGSGALFFFVGATVSPPNNLPAGSYTGTVTLTVSY